MLAQLASARATLEELARVFDAGELSADGAVRVVDELGSIRRTIDGLLAKAAKRVADTGVHEERGERSAAEMVGRAVGLPAGEVRAAIETATKLEHLAATDAAVRAGQLSAWQARVIADAATVNPRAEQHLLDVAQRGLIPLKDACIAARAAAEDPTARAARQHASRRFRMWTDDDGMVAGHFRLAPEVGGQVKAKIDAAVQRIFRGRPAGRAHEPHGAYAADALTSFVLDVGAPAMQNPNAAVHIVIDHGVLMRGGAVEGEVCEIPGVGPVDVSWVRELLGSAFLTVVIKRGRDILTVAHLGRHVPAEVRTALLVSGRACDVEGCDHRGYLERDHTHDYAKGGPTAFWNLGWLCYAHHRLKSSGWLLGPPNSETGKRTLRPPPARAA